MAVVVQKFKDKKKIARQATRRLLSVFCDDYGTRGCLSCAPLPQLHRIFLSKKAYTVRCWLLLCCSLGKKAAKTAKARNIF